MVAFAHCLVWEYSQLDSLCHFLRWDCEFNEVIFVLLHHLLLAEPLQISLEAVLLLLVDMHF